MNSPVEVGIQIVVLSIDSVDEASMDYSLTILLRQKWDDERLQFTTLDNDDSNATSESLNSTNSDIDSTSVGADRLELDTRMMDKVWCPDTYFVNERKARFHDLTVPNKLMHIFSNGTVFYSMRLSMTLTCHMILTHYPFDRQDCPLTVGSYGYTTKNLLFHWRTGEDAVVIHGDVQLPTFTLTHWDTTQCHDYVDESLGDFSCLQVSMYLSRTYGYYITQVYVPSMLIVALSWVNFWLDIDAIPARISLGLLTVLTMTTMSVGTRSNLPHVSYVKAIDVWTAACLLFVFAALLQFAYVNVTARVEKRRMSMRDAVKLATLKAAEEAKAGQMGGLSAGMAKKQQSQPVNKRERGRQLDKLARVIFPCAFAIFNLIYWCFYMT